MALDYRKCAEEIVANIGGRENVGGMEIYRTISVMSRGVVSDNGGWL